jgi:DNA-binding MarR family transcriptional regulator
MKCPSLGIDLDDREDLLMAFPRLLMMAGELTSKAGQVVGFGPYGLNMAKFNLLMALHLAQGPLSITDLKDVARLTRSPANVTQMLDDLEKHGLLKRIADADDRRISLIEITPAGRKLADEVHLRSHAMMEDYLRDFSSDELKCAAVAMIKWIWITADVAGFSHLKSTTDPFVDN